MADRKRKGRKELAEAPRAYDPDRRVVAVTGACGFIGGEVMRRLEEDRRYAKVLAIDIRKPTVSVDKMKFFKVDLTLPTADADLAAILRAEEADTFVHAAFLSAPTHSATWAHELEDIGTMHVLNAVAEARVRKLVVASTTMVYGANARNPNFLAETHELRGASTSESSGFINDKVSAERQVQRFRAENPGVVVSVLRAAPTLGPTVANFATRFYSRPYAPTLMGYDPLVQFVHENDLIDAYKIVLDEDHAGEFNIVADGVLPYSTVLAMMGKVPLPLPHFVASALGRVLWATQIASAPPGMLDFLRYLCVADGRRARESLGFEPRHDIRSTIHDFLGVEEQAGAEEGVHP